MFLKYQILCFHGGKKMSICADLFLVSVKCNNKKVHSGALVFGQWCSFSFLLWLNVNHTMWLICRWQLGASPLAWIALGELYRCLPSFKYYGTRYLPIIFLNLWVGGSWLLFSESVCGSSPHQSTCVLWTGKVWLGWPVGGVPGLWAIRHTVKSTLVPVLQRELGSLLHQ